MSKPIKDDLIERLKAYRLENKITQEGISKKIGVGYSQPYRWFNGKAKPNKIHRYHIEKLIKKI
jgi:transcriptional regulator with XRE-family HTH domain